MMMMHWKQYGRKSIHSLPLLLLISLSYEDLGETLKDCLGTETLLIYPRLDEEVASEEEQIPV